jgi:hypothetical protein
MTPVPVDPARAPFRALVEAAFGTPIARLHRARPTLAPLAPGAETATPFHPTLDALAADPAGPFARALAAWVATLPRAAAAPAPVVTACTWHVHLPGNSARPVPRPLVPTAPPGTTAWWVALADATATAALWVQATPTAPLVPVALPADTAIALPPTAAVAFPRNAEGRTVVLFSVLVGPPAG